MASDTKGKLMNIVGAGENGNEIVGSPQKTESCNIRFLGSRGKLIIHENVSLLTVNINVHDDAYIEIGSGSRYRGTLNVLTGCSVKIGKRLHCNSFLNISCAEETQVSIGDDCLISTAIIRPSDMHAIHDRTTGERINFGADVAIGNNVWLAQEAMILKGVTIGDGCAIAARAVVTKDIPAHSIAAGNPARVVRENIVWGGDFPLRRPGLGG
ncbi:acyltransferase [Aliirhizobium smilacinae]|uniref:Acyltransferase n=1 Tax=Aliirhizobium smilacinae TaxID=1395944 RepID=A0A5C4XS45_9HYPH|nr:acyltransferase [Rhizobium smilacinae]TNM66159.1 acyltransferase [Rhizobium smilacinae]